MPTLLGLSTPSGFAQMSKLNDMKYFFTCIAVLLLIQMAFGERVLSVGLVVYKNDSVILHNLNIEEGYTTEFTPPGEYALKITDASGSVLSKTSIELNFMLWSDPPVDSNFSQISLRIPYNQNMRTVTLFRGDKLIFSKNIDTCNRDNTCNIGFETYLSCPEDCPLNQKDGICILENDSVCDPDCAPNIDSDCSKKGPDAAGTYKFLPYLLLPVLLLIGFIIHKKHESARIKKEREDFLKWKEEQESLKNARKPPV